MGSLAVVVREMRNYRPRRRPHTPSTGVKKPGGKSENNVKPDTPPARHRSRPTVIAVLLALLLVAVWILVATGGGDRSAADSPAGPPSARAEPAAAQPEPTAAQPDPATPQPSDPPTVMPDGAPIPSPSPGLPEQVGEGATQAVAAVEVKDPVGLEETGDFETGVSVQLAQIEAVEGVARASGEIAGPALAVTVEAVNDTSGTVPLDGVTVFLSYGADRVPASVFGQGSAPLTGTLPAGSTATGTYVFAVPDEQREDIRVEVSYTGQAPTVAFAGSVG